VLHTRYTLEGYVGDEDWPNFQLDGFGTWLWGLAAHHQMTGSHMSEERSQAAQLTADYLAALWRQPCFDCWEEFPNERHPHTLAAIYGGLRSMASWLDHEHAGVCAEIREFVLQEGVRDGHFVKYIGGPQVDASLLGLAIPYGLVDVDDPTWLRTVERIELDLMKGGGVHRYEADTYYGGGQWVLLTAWLGWYYKHMGDVGRLDIVRDWIESQANEAGELPEQIPQNLNDPDFYPDWVDRWGPIATPLLWSHAMYLISTHDR
jgi:GH15 family glucan-1,4-alpha-glucosidase